MLAADVAAVANARCVGLIMETDSNKTAQQRTAQTVCECVSLCVFCAWKLCSNHASIDPRDTHWCTTCGFTDVRGLSGIICEQVE